MQHLTKKKKQTGNTDSSMEMNSLLNLIHFKNESQNMFHCSDRFCFPHLQKNKKAWRQKIMYISLSLQDHGEDGAHFQRSLGERRVIPWTIRPFYHRATQTLTGQTTMEILLIWDRSIQRKQQSGLVALLIYAICLVYMRRTGRKVISWDLNPRPF